MYSLSATYIAIDFDHEGARNLLASMEPTAIEGYLGYLTSGFRYHIAEEDGIILGVVGIRENKHLYHLFVPETQQKQGLSTELWRVAREACIAAGNPGEFTVNSSRLGLPYAKLGFVQVGDPENRGGVIATPMKLTKNASLQADAEKRRRLVQPMGWRFAPAGCVRGFDEGLDNVPTTRRVSPAEAMEIYETPGARGLTRLRAPRHRVRELARGSGPARAPAIPSLERTPLTRLRPYDSLERLRLSPSSRAAAQLANPLGVQRRTQALLKH